MEDRKMSEHQIQKEKTNQLLLPAPQLTHFQETMALIHLWGLKIKYFFQIPSFNTIKMVIKFQLEFKP